MCIKTRLTSLQKPILSTSFLRLFYVISIMRYRSLHNMYIFCILYVWQERIIGKTRRKWDSACVYLFFCVTLHANRI